MCKAQSILYLLLGGLTSEKSYMKSLKLQTQGSISQGQGPASPLNSHKVLQTEWAKRPFGYVLEEFRGRKTEIRQISSLAEAVSVSQIFNKKTITILVASHTSQVSSR